MTADNTLRSNHSENIKPSPKWWPALLLAGLLSTGLIALGYGLHGKPLAEKTLTALVMPVGMFWILLTGRLVQLTILRQGRGTAALFLLWLALTTLATRPVPRMVSRSIESSVTAYNPERDGALDVVVVLGGGTSQGNWRSQAAGAGDRLVMAAELYHLGLTRQLITTGQVTEGVSDSQPDPSEQTHAIWTKLQIPDASIRQVGGRNTYEEMQQLKQLWPELSGKRVGLLTSALHLPRAMRLAKAQGLELIPIAADVRSAVETWGLLNFIPSAGNLAELAQAQHELMAAWVSR